jgi:hypothetical protein
MGRVDATYAWTTSSAGVQQRMNLIIPRSAPSGYPNNDVPRVLTLRNRAESKSVTKIASAEHLTSA